MVSEACDGSHPGSAPFIRCPPGVPEDQLGNGGVTDDGGPAE